MLSSAPLDRMGLCSTCNNSPDCGYRNLRGFDAIFCELFDNYTPSNGNQRNKKSVSASRDNGPYPAAVNNGFKGLCINCENRSVCFLPKHEGGIWHCEEYS
jgi:hypothetical protein